MSKSNLTQTLATVVATLLVSTACIVGAVGPAQPGAAKAAVAVAARLVA